MAGGLVSGRGARTFGGETLPSPGRCQRPPALRYHPQCRHMAMIGHGDAARVSAFGHRLWGRAPCWIIVRGPQDMISANDYRAIADDCMRQADDAQDDRSRPLWATLAQSWLRLAEQAEGVGRHDGSTVADGGPGDGGRCAPA